MEKEAFLQDEREKLPRECQGKLPQGKKDELLCWLIHQLPWLPGARQLGHGSWLWPLDLGDKAGGELLQGGLELKKERTIVVEEVVHQPVLQQDVQAVPSGWLPPGHLWWRWSKMLDLLPSKLDNRCQRGGQAPHSWCGAL